MTPERWLQIEDLYHLACDQGTGVLANVDPELRRRVQELLAQNSGGKLLDRAAFDGMANSTRTQVSAGAQLGPYKIEALLGQGGMGQVFRAIDTRLGRTVALKVSQERFTDRFDREARAIAALNHPNICTLHDVGPDYLVMELVEGDTLAVRLKRGRLPMEQTIQYGAQIASALSAAHAKGIVHRDLKPGNIMITKAGVKVLDFGLAKSTQDETLTMANAVMGTPGYMAPEQREGKACDARTDIYALGLVLSEMATGARPRPGELPQLDSLPGKLAHVIERCLAQDPDDRWQNARDVKSELEWAMHRDVGLAGAAPAALWRRALPWGLFGVTALGFAAFAWLQLTGMKNAVSAEPLRLQIALPQKTPLQLTGALALSPDGRQLAFVASGADGIPRIWIRALNSLEMRPLPGTEAVNSLLFWKPDGRFIAFNSGGKLRKIDISGGPAETVCSLNLTGVGGTWNADGDILFGQFGGPIMRVSAAGGVAMPVTVLNASHGEVAHTEPRFLPDGRHFIYARDRSLDVAISAGSLGIKPEEQDSGRLVQASLGGAYAPSSDPGLGQLLFLRGRTLMAQPFDARHLKTFGEPVRVVEEPLAEYWDNGTFSVSANGTLVYWSPGNVESQLTWFDAQGNVQGTVGSPAPYLNVALSPDGTRALMSRVEADPDVFSPWMVDMSRGTSARYELGGSAATFSAVWAPDGRSIIFSSARTGQMEDIYEKQIVGAGDTQELVRSNAGKRALSWSPDGRFLLYLSIGGEKKYKLWVLPLQGDRKPLPLLRTEFDELDGRFSPDGRWIAYVSNESGRYEVYVRPFAPDHFPQGISNGAGKWPISDNGGSSPMWRQDGRELFYIDQDGKLIAVTISAGSGFQAGAPKVLFRAPRTGAIPGMTQWAPSPDGKRFLFLVPEKQEAAPLTVVLNWQAGLKKIALAANRTN